MKDFEEWLDMLGIEYREEDTFVDAMMTIHRALYDLIVDTRERK